MGSLASFWFGVGSGAARLSEVDWSLEGAGIEDVGKGLGLGCL